MPPYQFRKIGGKYCLWAYAMDLLIAYGLFTENNMLSVLEQPRPIDIDNLFWFVGVDFLRNILIGACIMLLFGHFLVQLARQSILIKGRNPVITGILTGLEVLATTGIFIRFV